MKKAYLINVLVFAVIFSFLGCAALVPREISETQKSIETARLAGAEEQCPEEYQEVLSMWDDALRCYLTCEKKREGLAKLNTTREKADMLCSKRDSDGDGVTDDLDKCPGTPCGVKVDNNGCPIDSDKDGVPDYMDKCPDTPLKVKVDRDGCPLDTDGDGVPDYLDKCPNTPKGVEVDQKGCPLDSDGDGVPDYLDKCPDTPRGVEVDTKGCPLDTDGDGVPDYLDKCPNTPRGARVNSVGCWILKGVQFGFNKSDVNPRYHSILDEVVSVLQKNPTLKIEIQGHTDNVGSRQYNQKLSERRATEVMDYFIKKGISRARLLARGYGFANPVTSNDTKEGQARNRRVQFKPIY